MTKTETKIVTREQWNALSDDEKKQWTEDHDQGVVCKAGGPSRPCGQKAGTPWWRDMCHVHEAEWNEWIHTVGLS
jgi:hypothetical protein